MHRLALAFLLVAPALRAQEAAAPEVVVAERGTIELTLTRKGVYVPAVAAELKLTLAQYKGELRIVEVAGHGARVNEGDVVLRLDTGAIDRQLAGARLALDRAELDFAHFQETLVMQAAQRAEGIARAERDLVRARTRLTAYLEHEKDFDEESERISRQAREHRMEDQKDELEQLERMYDEDELVDATEEIVLKRQRRNFARNRASFALSEKRRKLRKELYDPWKEEDLRRAVETKEAALTRVRTSDQLARAKGKLDLAKRQFDLDGRTKDFAELEADRAQFVVRAPRGGLLLHGEADAAPWPKRLAVDESLRNRQVFASVGSTDMHVKTSVDEKSILEVKHGAAARVTATARPGGAVTGRLELDAFPGKDGSFGARVALKDAGTAIRPGMTCEVEIVLAEARDAVLVPARAVREKAGESVATVARSKLGAFEERVVVTGVSDGEKIAVKDGIAEGEFVQVPAK